MKDLITNTRKYREKLLNDPYRPTYHFAFPDDNGVPGDCNGAFFVDGVYHIMHLYENSKTNAFHWAHVSSTDLLHWRHHPDALCSEAGDQGCFSGGGFLDDDKTAYITFWKFPSPDENGDNGGIAIAYAKPPYDEWHRITPIAIEGCRGDHWGTAEIEINGEIQYLSCADPSNIWKEDGYYYLQAGNKWMLERFGRAEDSDPYFQGDWTDLFRSKDLKKWEFVHRFYENTHKGTDWPDKTEDDMCPSFLPLYDAKENGNKTDKWLQLFISHNKGCQYYIGTLENEKFYPETHGRMTWNDTAYFAPEALIDDKNRHIMWTWLRDNMDNDFEKFGWSGVFSFPRIVWLENSALKMAPADELQKLEYNKFVPTISDDNTVSVNNGEIFRLKAVIDIKLQEKSGFCVRVDKESENKTKIYYDKSKQKLIFDATKSGKEGWTIKEEAPLTINENELLSLDIFVDKSVVEVYANEKQAICRRIYPDNPKNAVGLELIGKKSSVKHIEICDMAPTNPY